jgi:DNA repair photolyase
MAATREHADVLPSGAVRGRGAGLNPGNRFEGVRLHVEGELLDEQRAEAPRGRQEPTQVLEDASCTIVNHVDSPDLPFHWTLNPYRGCEHGCVYCYARPTHETLGFSCGLDFETRIMAKPDAPSLLRRFLARPSWRGDPIVMAGVTDCYQPIEARLGIMRGCLEVCADCRQPVSIVTKNRLITRDIDLLGTLNRFGAVHAAVSITTLDPVLAARLEPRASAPADRLRAVRELSAAGLPVTVMVAPIIPGLNDREIPAILEASAAAGARSARSLMLRLPHQVKALLLEWLVRHYPERAAKVERFIREMRGGELTSSRFGERMTGTGPMAEQIRATFELFARRHGLDRPSPPLSSAAFRPPERGGQLRLYE